MKKGYTHIGVVLDKSGSMASCYNDTLGGFNTFIQAQKELDGEATISIIQFNGNYNATIDMEAINDAVDLSKENYVPSGGTALLDAIGRTINNTDHAISEMEEDARPEKVIFVIITDGEENSSREFNRDQIMEMINRHTNEDKWEFIFIGANQDAIQAGGSMGVRATRAYTYTQDAVGTQTMYASLTRGMSNYRSKSAAEVSEDSYAFFSEDNDANDANNTKDKDTTARDTTKDVLQYGTGVRATNDED